MHTIYTYKYVRRRTTERQSLVSLFVSWLRWLVATGRVTQCMLRSILGVTMWAHEWVGARKNFKILIFFEFCHNAVYTVYIYSKDRSARKTWQSASSSTCCNAIDWVCGRPISMARLQRSPEPCIVCSIQMGHDCGRC